MTPAREWPEPVVLGFDESTALGQWQSWINHDHLQVKMRLAALERELKRVKDGVMPDLR